MINNPYRLKLSNSIKLIVKFIQVVNVKLIAKVLLCGDGSVGKTAIRERFLGKGFQSNYMMTIGADFAVKEIQGTSSDNEPYSIKCSIWDLSGQTNFKDVRSIYYKGSHAIIMVYDTSNRVSYNNINNWFEEIKKHTQINNLCMVLIGNKKDLRQEGNPNHIPYNEGLAKSKDIATTVYDNKWEVPFIETSALTGENISEAFDKLGQIFVDIKRKME